MNGETFHKILEPYLLAMALTVLILLGVLFLLYRDGRRRRLEMRDSVGLHLPPP